jgi:WD40 repeat protein
MALEGLQATLVFSPAHSLRELFKQEEPDWITTKPVIEDDWNPCLQTLEGHSNLVSTVVISHDGELIALALYDETVKIWDAT